MLELDVLFLPIFFTFRLLSISYLTSLLPPLNTTITYHHKTPDFTLLWRTTMNTISCQNNWFAFSILLGCVYNFFEEITNL